jgi:hypothetical protein
MNKKKFPLIPIEEGYVMVDRELDIYDHKYLVAIDSSGIFIKKSYNRTSIEGILLPHNLGGSIAYPEDAEGWTPIIAHTNIPSLKDSGLPLIHIPNKLHQLARECEVDENYQPKNATFYYGFIKGYKAAGGFSEDDMVEAFEKGYLQSGLDSLENQDEKPSKLKTISDASEEFRQSLKKHPVAVVVLMESDDSDPYEEFKAFDFKPKVVDGYIKIVEVIYEEVL